MSDDVDFMTLTRSLDRELARGGRLRHGMKKVLALVIPGVALVVVAAFLVVTDSVTIVITLSIVAMIIFELVRRGLSADGNSKGSGGAFS